MRIEITPVTMPRTPHPVAPTAGPWRVGDAGHTVFGPPSTGVPSPTIVAQRVRRADAALIAAAPALRDALAALVAMLDGARVGAPQLDTARAVLASIGGAR